MGQKLIMDLENSCTTELTGRMLVSDVAPRINIEKRPEENSSSDISMLHQNSMSAPIVWLRLWEEPAGINEILRVQSRSRRLTDPLYGGDILDTQLEEMASGAPGINDVWQITKEWPSLTRILLD